MDKSNDNREKDYTALKEKLELLEISYRELLDNNSSKITQLNDLISALKSEKALLENKVLNNKNTKFSQDEQIQNQNENINIKVNYAHNALNSDNSNIFNSYTLMAAKENLDNRLNNPETNKDNIISSSSNNNYYNNNSNFNLKKFEELKEEYKKLKQTFDECTQIIFDAIKTYSPNILEDDNISFQISPSGNINNFRNNLLLDSKNSENSHVSNISVFSDKEFVSKAVEIFKKYNTEINEKNKKLEIEMAEAESKMHMYKIMADEYKQALELSIKRNNINLNIDSMGNDPDAYHKNRNILDNNNSNINIVPNNIDQSNKIISNNIFKLNDKINIFNNNNQPFFNTSIKDMNFEDIKDITSNDKLRGKPELGNLFNDEAVLKLESEEQKDEEKNGIGRNNGINNNEYLFNSDNNTNNLFFNSAFKEINNAYYNKIFDDNILIQATAASAEILSSCRKKGKEKIESFCNFTIEDLMEADNASSNNNNNGNSKSNNIDLLNNKNENLIDNDNIRVNLSRLERYNNPERFKIITKKLIKKNFVWYLLCDKLTDLEFFSYETLLWVPGKIIEKNLNKFEVDKSAEIFEEKNISNYNSSGTNNANKLNNFFNSKCLECIKRSYLSNCSKAASKSVGHSISSSKKRSKYNININQINEKELNFSNRNHSADLVGENDKYQNNLLSLCELSRGHNNISNNKRTGKNSSLRDIENFENFENYLEDNNQDTDINDRLIKDIKFNSMMREKNLEIEKLISIQNDLCKKLNDKHLETMEHKQLTDKLLRAAYEDSGNNKSKNVSYEKYEILFNQFKKEQDKRSELSKCYEELKLELESANNKINELNKNKENKIKLKTKKIESKINLKLDNELNNISLDFDKDGVKKLIGNKLNIANNYNTSDNAKIDVNRNCNSNNSAADKKSASKKNEVFNNYVSSGGVCNTAGNNYVFTLNSSHNNESEYRDKKAGFITEAVLVVINKYFYHTRFFCSNKRNIKLFNYKLIF